MNAPSPFTALLLCATGLLPGCGWAEAEVFTPDPASGVPSAEATDVFETLLPAAEQRSALCSRNNTDPISRALCAEPAPNITSLQDLQRLLGLGFKPGVLANGAQGNPAFTLTGHSSSLVMKSVNAINPRALLSTTSLGQCTSPEACNAGQTSNPKLIAMGFARGEQFVELVTRDGRTRELMFFLLRFEQACNAAGGCSLSDLLTPAVESGWTSVALYQDVDLRNTVLDCLHCHQPGGPSAQKMLRMQELQRPWTHFLREDTESGKQLLADYRLAHEPTEPYAGIPGELIPKADAALLENLVVEEGGLNQPNEFLPQVETEVGATPDGQSLAWQKLYQRALEGVAIAVPYRKIRVSDAGRLKAAATGYRAVLAGQAPAASLPDVRDTFLEEALPDISLRAKPGLSGRGLLQQMCQRCHNSKLDPLLTKSRFNVEKLGELPRVEKELAIERLKVPERSLLRMPPPRFGSLTAEEIARITEELRRQ